MPLVLMEKRPAFEERGSYAGRFGADGADVLRGRYQGRGSGKVRRALGGMKSRSSPRTMY